MEMTYISNRNLSSIANILADHIMLETFEGVRKYGFPVPSQVKDYYRKYCAEYTDLGSTLYYQLRGLNVVSLKKCYEAQPDKATQILLSEKSAKIYQPEQCLGIPKGNAPEGTICSVTDKHYQLLKFLNWFLMNTTGLDGKFNASKHSTSMDELFDAVISYRDALCNYIVCSSDYYKTAVYE